MRPGRVLLYLYLAFVMVLMFFVSLCIAAAFFDVSRGGCTVLPNPIHYETSDMQGGEIHLPNRIGVRRGGSVTVTAKLPEVYAGETYLAYYPYHQEAYVYIDGDLREHYNGTDSFFETNLPSKGVRFIPISQQDAGKDLSVTYTSKEQRYIGVLNEILIGSPRAVLYHNFHGTLFVMVVGMLILFYGMMLFGISFAQADRELRLPYNYLGMLSFCVGAWFVLQTNAGQIFVGNTAWLQWIETLMLAMVPFPMARFMDICEQRRYGKAFDIVSILNLGVVLLDLLLTAVGCDMLMIIWVIHAAIAISTVCGLVSIILLKLHEKEIYANIRWIVAASLIMAACGLAEIFVYYVLPQFGDGTFFIIGVLTFLLCCFIWVRQRHLRHMTVRQTVVAQSRMRNALLENVSNAIERPTEIVQTQSAAIASICNSQWTRKAADDIHDEAARILSMLDDIADYVKLETKMLSPQNIPYEVESLVRAIGRRAEIYRTNKDIQFSCDVDPMVPKALLGDVEKIKRIINSLLASSFRFTKEGGVHVSLAFSAAGFVRRGDLTITVADSGGGIPKDVNANRLFVMTKQNADSNGPTLSLSVVGGMARMLGGNVRIKETNEHGTTIVVTIPQQVVDAASYSGGTR